MRLFLFILINISPIILLAQDGYYYFDTSYYVVQINKDTLNGRIEDFDIQNGSIKQFKKILYSRPARKIPRKVNQVTFPLEKIIQYDLIYEGQFSQGKRISEWTYWSPGYNPNSGCNLKLAYKRIRYEPDSIILQEFSSNSRLVFNSDSSLIKGKIKLNNTYNVEIDCKDSLCRFFNEKVEIAKSNIKNWKNTLDRIEYNVIRSKMLPKYSE